MATHTPPPYFPQGALSPPDENRYRRFKLVLAGIGLLIVMLLAGLGIGVWYLVKSLF